MTTRLESKVIVITGGSSGIGKAVAKRVACEGAAVVIGARREDVGDAVAASLRAAGGQAIFVATDGTVEADVAALIRTALTEFGRLDGAFNNVGGVHTLDVVQNIDAAAIREECPVIGVWHSGGAKLTEGVAALDGVGQVFAAMIRASGRSRRSPSSSVRQRAAQPTVQHSQI